MVRRKLEVRSSMPSGEATLTDKCDGGAYPQSYSSCGLDRLAIASYSYVFSWRGIIVGRGSAERPTIWVYLFMGRLLCYGVLLFSVRPLDQRGRERERELRGLLQPQRRIETHRRRRCRCRWQCRKPTAFVSSCFFNAK